MNHCEIKRDSEIKRTDFFRNGRTNEILVIGNPNVGKSCLFNSMTGLSAEVSNYPGTTVDIYFGLLKLNNKVTVADLPGIYSLNGSTEEEAITRDYLFRYKPGLVINIIDATKLERNLFLTVQLRELGIPMVIALNFSDEARKKGVKIDSGKLSSSLGVLVFEIDAQDGQGVEYLLKKCLTMMQRKGKQGAYYIDYGVKTEKRIIKVAQRIESTEVNKRFVAINLIENNSSYWKFVGNKEDVIDKVKKYQSKSVNARITNIRYLLIGAIMKEATNRPDAERLMFNEKVLRVLINPKFGYYILVAVMLSVFLILFSVGEFIEELLVKGYDSTIVAWLLPLLNQIPNIYLSSFLEYGFVRGIEAGLAIVVPYITVFYLLMAILEDTGYLPVMAYLLDKAMHRFRLHGNSLIPLMLGLGCNVPAILSTRTLQSKSEKLMTATLISCLIPCSALIAVIIGSVGKNIGAGYALSIFLLNFILLVIIAFILGKYMIKEKSGFIIELPPLRMPTLHNVLMKTWFRCKEFIVMAFPYIIIGSGVVGVLIIGNTLHYITDFFRPVISGLLGLPDMAGITLIYGFLRKEMALEMLVTLGGSNNLLSFMTPLQIYVFAIVTAFYIPCIATFVVLKKEFGWKNATIIGASSIAFAIILGAIAYRILPILGLLQIRA